MGRKYEVYIDGQPLLIVGDDGRDAVPDGVVVVRAGSAAEIAAMLEERARSGGQVPLALMGADVDEVWDAFRSNYRFVQAAGGCVTDEHMRLLAIHRLGLWDLPKGKVDEGEAVDAAAIREVREECGLLSVELIERLQETWHTYERKGHHFLKRTDWYLMRGDSREPLVPQGEEDITAVRWMDAAGLDELRKATYPSLLPVIAAWERAVRRRA